MRLKGDQSTTRALNRRLVLDELRRNGPMSRAVLADSVGLSPAAVTFVTADLLEEGLIAEGTAVAGAPGRRPIPLEIKYDSRFSIGIRAESSGISGVITDLATEVLAESTAPLQDFRVETVLEAVATVVEEMIVDAAVQKDTIIGIGAAFSGEIDGEAGICRQIQRYGWENVRFAEMLATRTGLPTWVDNNVNAFAVSQHLFGHGQGKANLAAIALGEGVGAGFILDGRLFRGSTGAAGEFGHSLEERGRICACGRDGCLEAYTSIRGLLASWVEQDGPETPTMQDFINAVRAGDPVAVSIARDAGYRIGRHLAGLVNMINPDIMVYHGECVELGEAMFGPVNEVLEEFCFPGAPQTRVAAGPTRIAAGDTDWPRGAAALAIQHFFDFESSGGAQAAETDRSPTHGVRHYEPA